MFLWQIACDPLLSIFFRLLPCSSPLPLFFSRPSAFGSTPQMFPSALCYDLLPLSGCSYPPRFSFHCWAPNVLIQALLPSLADAPIRLGHCCAVWSGCSYIGLGFSLLGLFLPLSLPGCGRIRLSSTPSSPRFVMSFSPSLCRPALWHPPSAQHSNLPLPLFPSCLSAFTFHILSCLHHGPWHWSFRPPQLIPRHHLGDGSYPMSPRSTRFVTESRIPAK